MAEMTPKETMEWLKSIKEKYIHGGDQAFDVKRKAAIDTAIEILEKQMPKKVMYKCKAGAVCPDCDGNLDVDIKKGFYIFENIVRIRQKTPYCKYCGQALDWSDRDE